jgi:hypothetical protein
MPRARVLCLFPHSLKKFAKRELREVFYLESKAIAQLIGAFVGQSVVNYQCRLWSPNENPRAPGDQFFLSHFDQPYM